MKKFWIEENGVSTIEIAIITAALLALALVFKNKMLEFCQILAKKVL